MSEPHTVSEPSSEYAYYRKVQETTGKLWIATKALREEHENFLYQFSLLNDEQHVPESCPTCKLIAELEEVKS